MSGSRALDRQVRVTEVRLGPEIEQSVLDVVRSGHLAQGPKVAELEGLGAAMAGTRFAVAVNSGTAALEAAYEALGLQPGDEVVMPPLTFAATLNAALRCGLRVRFADVGADGNLDADAAREAIGPATAALVPVHLYGLPAPVDELARLAGTRGLALVEDAAQAHGARVGDRPVGSFGVGCFSFYATKNVCAGEGGLVTTDSEQLADKLRVLRNQGMRARYEYEMVGRNLRMTDLAAAVAVPQLRPGALEAIQARRAGNADRLRELLGGVSGLVLPFEPAGRTSSWHQFTVLVPEGVDRDQVVDRLAGHGVHVGVYYPRLVWDSPAYRDRPDIDRGDTPRAREVVARCLSLPVHPYLTPDDVEHVARSLQLALR